MLALTLKVGAVPAFAATDPEPVAGSSLANQIHP
jgi:hypothetical protein